MCLSDSVITATRALRLAVTPARVADRGTSGETVTVEAAAK